MMSAFGPTLDFAKRHALTNHRFRSRACSRGDQCCRLGVQHLHRAGRDASDRRPQLSRSLAKMPAKASG
jgi:hypothetical protein